MSQYKNFSFQRYPKSDSKSLRVWSSADEYMLKYIEDKNADLGRVFIYNDRFAFLDINLSNYNTLSISLNSSQNTAIDINRRLNNIEDNERVSSIFEERSNCDIALVKTPKSLDLFRLFLIDIAENSNDNVEVVCSFMTKYFNKGLLKIAGEYFEEVYQSLAWKKSRLLILRKKKKNVDLEKLVEINYTNKIFKQYYGVFSAKHIDYATQFLLENLKIESTEHNVLDLASGNGVIASYVQERNSNSNVHLLDESLLAIESSKFNVDSSSAYFHYAENLNSFDDNYFDLIVSNPPFHIEHENNIEVSLNLFKEVRRIIKKNGSFTLVANKHLNYKTHLLDIFNIVDVISENEKFIIYKCYNYSSL